MLGIILANLLCCYFSLDQNIKLHRSIISRPACNMGQKTNILSIFYLFLIIIIIYTKFRLINATNYDEISSEGSNNDDEAAVTNSIDSESDTISSINERTEVAPNRLRLRLVSAGQDQQRRRVRQDIYNFYNSHQPPQNQRPTYRPNYYRPRPRPSYNDDIYDYDDDNDAYYQLRPRPPPPLRPYDPYRPYLPRPLIVTTTTTTTAAPASDTLKPIGYMLIDTYHTPGGSYSRPIAFFGK